MEETDCLDPSDMDGITTKPKSSRIPLPNQQEMLDAWMKNSESGMLI